MKALNTALSVAVSLTIMSTLRAADVTDGPASQPPPRSQNFGLPLDQLDLTNDQKAKVSELWKAYGPRLAELEQKMAASLTDEQRQARRAAEQAARAAGKAPKEMREAVEAATQATDEQKARFAELRQAMAPLQREIREKLLALLTPEQTENLHGQAGVARGAAAPAGTSAGAPAGAPSGSSVIQPIESLWLLTIPHFPVTREMDAALALALKKWQATGVFDAISLLDPPPTFVCEKGFIKPANALIKEVGGSFIVSTLPVGQEGWESSANPRLAKKFAGTHYDASKALPQLQWLETMKELKADMWGWVPEQTAQRPTSDQVARSAGEFARFAKAQHKTAVIWLTAQALTRGHEELIRQICEATRTNADFYVWMDLEEESLQAGEPRWRETMGHILDQILKLTPKEKTVVQWINNPRWPAKDAEGTKAYLSVCQAKGINRFGMLCMPQALLEREPWYEFYRTLPKAGGKRGTP